MTWVLKTIRYYVEFRKLNIESANGEAELSVGVCVEIHEFNKVRLRFSSEVLLQLR